MVRDDGGIYLESVKEPTHRGLQLAESQSIHLASAFHGLACCCNQLIREDKSQSYPLRSIRCFLEACFRKDRDRDAVLGRICYPRTVVAGMWQLIASPDEHELRDEDMIKSEKSRHRIDCSAMHQRSGLDR